MRSTDAYGSLLGMGRPVLSTRDAADRLRLSLPTANRLLGRLTSAGLALGLRHGLWSLQPKIDPLSLPEYLTAPQPAYVSLQSALWLRGVIEQVPTVIYVVSLGRPGRIETSVGTFSVHRVPPELFGGFEIIEPGGIHLATPEKALVVTIYLSNARSRLFAHWPEIDLSPPFDPARARAFVQRIPDPRRRAWVGLRLESALSEAGARLSAVVGR